MEAIAFLAFFGVFTLTILLALLVIALDNLIVPPQKPTLPDTTTIRMPPVDGRHQ